MLGPTLILKQWQYVDLPLFHWIEPNRVLLPPSQEYKIHLYLTIRNRMATVLASGPFYTFPVTIHHILYTEGNAICSWKKCVCTVLREAHGSFNSVWCFAHQLFQSILPSLSKTILAIKLHQILDRYSKQHIKMDFPSSCPVVIKEKSLTYSTIRNSGILNGRPIYFSITIKQNIWSINSFGLHNRQILWNKAI